MKRIEPPYFAMSGVQLGFGLAVLSQQLVEESRRLTSVDPNDDELKGRDLERVHVASAASWQLTMIRARLQRYATLAVAKQRPDAVLLPPQTPRSHDEKEREVDGRANAYDVVDGATAVSVAKDVLTICRVLVECEDGYVEETCHQLDVALERHATLCSLLNDKLVAKAHELDMRDD